MDNKSIKDYDIVISRSVTTNGEIPLLKINENNEYIAIPVREQCDYIFINNIINNLVNLICCDNKR